MPPLFIFITEYICLTAKINKINFFQALNNAK